MLLYWIGCDFRLNSRLRNCDLCISLHRRMFPEMSRAMGMSTLEQAHLKASRSLC